jgi:hypothetical protein
MFACCVKIQGPGAENVSVANVGLLLKWHCYRAYRFAGSAMTTH